MFDHKEKISDRETWRELKERISHLCFQGFEVKVRYDTNELIVLTPKTEEVGEQKV